MKYIMTRKAVQWSGRGLLPYRTHTRTFLYYCRYVYYTKGSSVSKPVCEVRDQKLYATAVSHKLTHILFGA
jgi:hypothetical protein